MNNIFKIIWNQATQLFVVTSELAKGKAKSSSHSPSAKAESSSMPTYSLLSTSILFGLLATNANAAVVEQNNSNAITNITTDTGIVIGQGASAYGEGTSISRDLIAIGNNAKATERTKRVTLFHYRTPGNMDWRDITGRLTNIDVDPLWGYSLGAYDNNEFIARAAPSMALGYESYAFGGSVAMGAYSHAGEKVGANNQNSLAVAIGSYTTATGNGAVAMGPAASAQGNNSFALMRQASATGGNAMALGAASYASTDGAIAIGRIATSTGKNAIAIGTGGEGSGATSYLDRSQATTASGDNSIALGHNVNVTTTDSIAIGRESKAHQDNSVALGALSETRAATAETTGIVNGFTYGNFAAQGSTANGVVSIGKAGAERQLVNVAAGKVSSDSTDAINGSQLFMTNRGLSYLGDTLVTNVLGGNAAVEKSGNTLGTLTMSNIGGTGKNTIDEAIKAAKTEVKAEKQATVSKADGANGQAIYTVGATKTTLNAGTKVSVTGGTEDASGILAYTVGLDAATNDKIDSIGSGNVAAGDTNTVTGATVYNYIQSNPITFVGEDNTNPVKTKLGETIKFTGGDVDTDYKGTNIKVKSNGSEIVVGFKDAPTFTNITADSLNISNGGPTINKDGINMNNKKITNVAAGEADTDAVNVAQLKEAKANIANIANNVQLLEDNSPFEYADKDGNAVKKGLDGQFYKPESLQNKVFVNGKYYDSADVNSDGTLRDPATAQAVTPIVNEVVIRAKGTEPQTVTNVKSNLPSTYNQVTDENGNPIQDTNGNPVITTTAQAAPSVSDVKNMGNNAATVNDILNAGWNLQENGSAKDFVKAYDTVNFVDGEGIKANVTVRENGAIMDVTFNLDKGNITMNQNGTAQGSSATEKDAAEKALKDAKETLANLSPTAPSVVKAAAEKAVQDAQKGLDNINNKVATVENVVYAINNASWTATSGTEGSGKRVENTAASEEQVKAGETVKLNAGNNLMIKQEDKTFTYSLNPNLTKLESAEFKDNAGNTTVTDGNGVVITPAEQNKAAVLLTSNGLNNGGNKITGVANGDIASNSQEAVTGDQLYNYVQVNGAPATKDTGNVNFVNGTGTKVEITDGGDVAYSIDTTTLTVSDGSATNPDGSIVNEGAIVTPTAANAQRMVTANDLANAINNAGWRVDSAKVEGSTGKVIEDSPIKPTKVKVGDSLQINAGNNIEITRNGQSVNIATSATPSFTHVNLGANGARIGSDAEGNVRVSNAQGGPARITNVAPAISNTDAVNYGQLKGAINNVNNQINKVDKDLRAGIAGATAMAFLQRPNEAGKSVVSVGAAGYRGESALAVGYAKNADNNKVSIKLGVGLNSRSDVTYGGSVGYQW